MLRQQPKTRRQAGHQNGGFESSWVSRSLMLTLLIFQRTHLFRPASQLCMWQTSCALQLPNAAARRQGIHTPFALARWTLHECGHGAHCHGPVRELCSPQSSPARAATGAALLVLLLSHSSELHQQANRRTARNLRSLGKRPCMVAATCYLEWYGHTCIAIYSWHQPSLENGHHMIGPDNGRPKTLGAWAR